MIVGAATSTPNANHEIVTSPKKYSGKFMKNNKNHVKDKVLVIRLMTSA